MYQWKIICLFAILILLSACSLKSSQTIDTIEPAETIEPTETIEPIVPTDVVSEQPDESLSSYTPGQTSQPAESPAEESPVQYEDYKGAYRAVISDVLERWPRTSPDQVLLGTLYDLNGDGQDELLMIYEEYGTWLTYYAVWTYDSGIPLLLAEDELANRAGSGRGGLTMVTYEEETYLCLWEYNVAAGVNYKYTYNYKLFSTADYQLTEDHSFYLRFIYDNESYETKTVMRENSAFLKDGVEISYEEFEEVFSVLSNSDHELLSTLNIAETMPDKVGTPLEGLLEELGD